MKLHTRIAALAASAAVVASGAFGMTAASAGTHNVKPHATNVCNNNSGSPCLDLSSLLFDQGNAPQLIQNASSLGSVGGGFQGRKINLRQRSDSRSNEDFIMREVGTIGELCGNPGVNGIDPSNYVCLNYDNHLTGSNFPVFQAKFAPDSNVSGFCVGTFGTNAQEGYKARLERCGQPTTFWVPDLFSDITITLPGFGAQIYAPLVNASDTFASNPLALTVNPNSTRPGNQLTVQQENFQGGKVPDRQMFTITGPPGFRL